MKSTCIKYIGKSARGFAKQKYKYTFSEKITHIDIELIQNENSMKKKSASVKNGPHCRNFFHVFLLVWSLTILRQKDTPQSTHFLT